MNKKNLFLYEIISTLFIIFLGFLFHFIYEWSNNNVLISIFSPVNESIWEHLKLLFFPTLITIIIGSFIFKHEYKNYLCNKTCGLIIGMFFIVVFFYTYSGIIGRNIALIDISSFIVATLITEIYSYRNILNNKECNKYLATISLIIFIFLFILFTYKTPLIGLFKDPVNGTFGLN